MRISAWNGRLLARVAALEERLDPSGTGPTASPVDTSSALPIGARAPRFALDNVDGRPVSLDYLCGRGKPVLLVFSDPGCGPCRALLPDLASWQHAHPTEVTVTVISRGTPAAHQHPDLIGSLPRVLLQKRRYSR